MLLIKKSKQTEGQINLSLIAAWLDLKQVSALLQNVIIHVFHFVATDQLNAEMNFSPGR